MAMRRGPPLAVGSAAWIAEERNAATSMADSEIEEFSFAARNEMDWLNEHMAEIFSQNQMNVIELFKTPGKLRGKTPRTARKAPLGEARVPLSDVFSSTPKGAQNPFAMALEQARTPKIRVAEDRPERPVSRPTSPAKTIAAPTKPAAPAAPAPVPLIDSGYHGSQTQETVDVDMLDRDVDLVVQQSPQRAVDATDFALLSAPRPLPEQPSPTEETFQSAREEPTRTAYVTAKVASPASPTYSHVSSPVAARAPSPVTSPRSPSPRKMASPNKSSPLKSSPLKQVQHTNETRGFPQPADLTAAIDVHEDEDIRSPSDGPSPPRQLVRKSSLNLPRLPAREPLTNNRMSRGQPDHTRTSFFNRHTGGKSLGGVVRQDFVDDDDDEDEDEDEMDIDETVGPREDTTTKIAAHTKTYTQRLQDQISMLGKAQPPIPRPSSKSIANLLPAQQSTATVNSQPLQAQPEPEARVLFSPKPKQSVPAPGAFPEDDDDDWIDPPAKAPVAASPRPTLPKSHSAEAVPSVPRKEAANDDFVRPKSRPGSPNKAPLIPERTTSAPLHTKSASVPYLPTMDLDNGDDLTLKKTISVSNPTLPTVSEDGSSMTPSKSSRTFRGSPLKNVKDKLSRILTSSKGLLASSAAISAEGKASLLSTSTTRLGMHANASVDTFRTAENVLYPDLSHHGEPPSRPISPARTNSSRRTRASAEREKKEAKEREKEVKQREKELKEMKKQTEKLEKVRDKEAEKARVFSKEQEKVAAMERQISAQREQEKASQSQAQLQQLKTPAPPKKVTPISPPKPTRTSPRKTKADADNNLSSENDVDIAEATTTMPPPSVPRSAIASASRPQTVKKSLKPSREPLVKSRQPPATVIRVNTTSSQQSQYHSTSALSANLQETLGQQPAPPRQLTSKPSHTMLHSKSSMASLAGSVSSSGPGRPKALGIAAKRKEQEEREAQQKREAKQEMERKRAVLEAERKQEEHRKAEAEKQQREEERKARKAALEKAKQTKAPPAAVRSQPNGPPEYMAEKAPPRPASRLGNTVQQKAPSKRPLQQEAEEKPQPPRTMASYHQSKEAKRMRMSEEFDQDIDMADTQPNIKGPPIRPSAGLKKDLAKSMFPNGYSNAPSQSANHNLLRTAVATAQHNGQAKAANPMDMAQVSKGPIVFAPNPNAQSQAHKTPARTALTSKQQPKSAKSSPRFQNGDAIELPEINTDDEDSDEDDSHIAIAPWADSPALKAGLMAQEMMDPSQIFGPPRPINMEEVFSKSKDRFHKFRARTSSANWSGSDRLTEEDIRKDLRAREKLRKEGGWSYELSREMS
ncbi:hypothetical protein B0T16DRAFT_330274 [Cercophora newfieldiana]|uniref:Inner centromere protein ARK-binding domain-containing protein n=1 Tax=Cercophora newfieldiana TaxID=92897 RepID=A0AA39Y3U0_9PEZI|nr:hypothetical protein B0T16DRAFT_330274 [Cercophora newfieldiana]